MSTSPISFTTDALSHVRKQLAQTRAAYLRLGVKESGCNGFMYTLDFLDDPLPDDQAFEFEEDVRVCVSEGDMALVAGTEVDMITQGLNSALVFKNPKATSYCGCGESFALDDGTADSDIDTGDLAYEAASGGDERA